MNEKSAVVPAHDALANHDWSRARDLFLTVGDRPLTADDSYGLAKADWWLGLVQDALDAYEQAYHGYLGERRPERAAFAAFDIAGSLFLRGDHAQGSGWMSRFNRLLHELPDGLVHEYARFVDLDARADRMDADGVIEQAQRLHAAGERYADLTLCALALMVQGRTTVRRGQVEPGMAVLDEAMLAAGSGRMDPAFAGNIYCNVVATCHAVLDIRRMREWTRVLARWCESLPPAVLFTGICRVHRAQLLQMAGDWGRAEREAARVCAELAGIQVASVAEAHYLLGEIRLLRGDLAGAEEQLRLAGRLGRDPQPALALLRAARGDTGGAAAMLDAALAGTAGRPPERIRCLAALVEVALDRGDPDSAERAAGELERLAADYPTTGLAGLSAQARGAVLVAGGHPQTALPVLQAALRTWQELDAPHAAARVRVLVARAHAALGDPAGAAVALDGATEAFIRLGAAPDLARSRHRPARPDGLTGREAQVLALVAAGRTNQQIGEILFISHKTVARHLSSIFTKCGVSSRAAAAAYAVAHGLAAGDG